MVSIPLNKSGLNKLPLAGALQHNGLRERLHASSVFSNRLLLEVVVFVFVKV